MKIVKRLIPLAILALLLGLFFYFEGHEYLKWEKIKEVHKEGLTFVEKHPYYAALLFLLIYAFVVVSFIPGLIPLDLLAGFLFGPIIGVLLIVVGATTGGCIIFLIARYALGDYGATKASGLIHKIREGFDRNPSSYLLFMRILPLFPFGLVSMATAFLNVSFKRFLWTTAFGMIPLAIVFTQAGTGLGAIFEKHEKVDINLLLNTNILIALSGLAFMSLLPIFFKKKKAESGGDPPN